MIKTSIFTVLPQLGEIKNVVFTYDDGSTIDLNGEMLESWSKDYNTMVTLWFSVVAKNAENLGKDVSVSAEQSLKEVFNKQK